MHEIKLGSSTHEFVRQLALLQRALQTCLQLILFSRAHWK